MRSCSRSPGDREAELAEKSLVLEATLENMGQGLAAFDADLRLTAWNTRCLELLDSPWPSPCRRAFADIVRIRRSGETTGRATSKSWWRSAWKWPRCRTLLGRAPARQRVVVEMQKHSVRGGGFVLTYSDITARRQAGEELRQAKEAAEAASRARASFSPT
jgi:PAS domain-containing protein